jgi:hypothetical protein
MIYCQIQFSTIIEFSSDCDFFSKFKRNKTTLNVVFLTHGTLFLNFNV